MNEHASTLRKLGYANAQISKPLWMAAKEIERLESVITELTARSITGAESAMPGGSITDEQNAVLSGYIAGTHSIGKLAEVLGYHRGQFDDVAGAFSQKIDELKADNAKLREALSTIQANLVEAVRSAPCTLEGGALGWPQFDMDGNEVGVQYVDPISHIGSVYQEINNVSDIAREALEQTEPKGDQIA